MTASVCLLSPPRGLHGRRSALYDGMRAPDAVSPREAARPEAMGGPERHGQMPGHVPWPGSTPTKERLQP